MISVAPESDLIEAVTLADPLGSCTHGEKPDVLCCLKELNSVTSPPGACLIFVFLFLFSA